MKRFTLLLLATLSITAAWAAEFTVGKIKYRITDDSNHYVEVIYNDTDYYYGAIVIPESVTYNETIYTVTAIGAEAFKSRPITSVTIPESVTTIGSSAFLQCNKLTSVTIPENTTTIGETAFATCTSLTEITIPESVTSIGIKAFINCTGLTTINYNATNCSITTTGLDISSNPPFKGCSKVTTLTIGESVESVPQYMIQGISVETFYLNALNCTFQGNGQAMSTTNLTYAIIGSNVESIYGYIFYNCSALAEITSLATTPPNIGNIFWETPTNNVTIIVPAASIEAYKGKDYWKNFYSYQAYEKITTNKIFYLDCNDQTEWAVDADSDVQAVFTNVITGYKTTVQGIVEQNIIDEESYTSVVFYLAEGNSYATTGVEDALYTHVEFKLNNVTRSEETTLTTGALYVADADKYIYNLANKEWVGVNEATDIEETIAEGAIEVCGDVVTAFGDIYVYNMSGVMVANSRDEIDLSTLQRGIYLIQAGGTVKKIVK